MIEYTVNVWAGGCEWYLKNKLHREDGPAAEYSDGSKWWYLNDKLHREDGPAIERADGTKEWWLNNKLHREDGPAIERADGSKFWYLNDVHVTQADHKRRTTAVQELTIAEIEALLGYQVKIVK